MQEYPPEVCSPPVLLAGLVGATQIHGRLTELLHHAAEEALGHRRLRYESFSYDMRVPPCKRGGKDSSGYKVQGVLKLQWLQKVCSTIPAVLVVCFDWGEVRPDHAEVVQATQQLQHALRQARDREIRVMVFAVLQPGTTDAEVLCLPLRQQLEGTSSQLVIVQGLSSDSTKLQKLERLVYQSAVSFYADEERRLKAWTESLHFPAWAKNALQVRIRIKTGFLSEFRKDTRGALLSYITAYQMLMHKTEHAIPDVVERIGLCNHLSFRMYQLYLQSRDLAAAVHHCRIHTNTLRHSDESDREGVTSWRKWHWLASNHQLFAELLESVLQHSPIILDHSDMWQFPGFHYQAAAGYIRRLKQWVDIISQDDRYRPSNKGGEIVASPFVGQRGAPEHPEQLGGAAAAAAEVDAREAYQQCFVEDHGQRALAMLTRAQAAYKERNYPSGATVCSARMAEVYLEDGNLLGATKLYERLRRERSEGDEPAVTKFVRWPALQRFALERSVLCAFQKLGISAVPSVCKRSASLLQRRLALVAPSFSPDQAAVQLQPEELSQVRRQLLEDGFAYLSAINESPGHDPVELDAQSELLGALRAAAGDEADGGLPMEVPLQCEAAEVAFGPHSRVGGCELTVTLRTQLPVALELAGAVAVTSLGEAVLAPTGGGEWSAASWHTGNDLTLAGAWPAAAAAGGDREERLLSVRLVWAAAPNVWLVVRHLALQRSGGTARLLPELRLPHSRAAIGSSAASLLGVPRPPREALPLRAEYWLPADPTAALISEPFVLHVVLVMDQLSKDSPFRSPASLSLSCTVQVQEDPDVRVAAVGEDPKAFLLDGEESTAPWSMLAFGEDEHSLRVAEVSAEGELRPAARVFAVARSRVEPAVQLKAAAGAASALVVPVVLRSGRDCRAVLSLRVEARAEGDSNRLLDSIVMPTVTVHFRGALLVSFDEPGSHSKTVVPGSRSNALPRRFSVKAVTPVAVQLCRVEAIPLRKGADGELTRDAPAHVLGSMGRVAPGALHVLALPPGQDPEGASILAASFVRDAFLASFFPWLAADGSDLEPRLRGQPPQGSVEWPIPCDTRPARAAAPAAELAHAPTACVAEPLDVRVIVTGPTRFAQELKIRIVGTDPGEGQERYFLSGPTNTQTVLLGTDGKPQVCTAFTLLPLRSGVLTLPRAHVSAGEWEATSNPSSVFVFPAGQQVVSRSLP